MAEAGCEGACCRNIGPPGAAQRSRARACSLKWVCGSVFGAFPPSSDLGLSFRQIFPQSGCQSCFAHGLAGWGRTLLISLGATFARGRILVLALRLRFALQLSIPWRQLGSRSGVVADFAHWPAGVPYPSIAIGRSGAALFHASGPGPRPTLATARWIWQVPALEGLKSGFATPRLNALLMIGALAVLQSDAAVAQG